MSCAKVTSFSHSSATLRVTSGRSFPLGNIHKLEGFSSNPFVSATLPGLENEWQASLQIPTEKFELVEPHNQSMLSNGISLWGTPWRYSQIDFEAEPRRTGNNWEIGCEEFTDPPKNSQGSTKHQPCKDKDPPVMGTVDLAEVLVDVHRGCPRWWGFR